MFWRFFLPGGYSPDRLIEGLTPALGHPDNNLQGFHIFTFNELGATEAWRRGWLARLN
jgi:methylenetetrahydrofolate reductase (NADPH)